jgi:hypothetical protein
VIDVDVLSDEDPFGGYRCVIQVASVIRWYERISSLAVTLDIQGKADLGILPSSVVAMDQFEK